MPLFFEILGHVITKTAREGLINEILYTDDLVFMSESLEILREKFLKWKEAFEGKRLKANLYKTKVMVSGLKEEIIKSKVDS